MKVRIRSTPQADQQTIHAAVWWRSNRPKAPRLFREELTGVLSLLAAAPEMGASVRHATIPSLRRVLLPATQYHIYYVYDELANEIVVLGVWSARRGRPPKLSRS